MTLGGRVSLNQLLLDQFYAHKLFILTFNISLIYQLQISVELYSYFVPPVKLS